MTQITILDRQVSVPFTMQVDTPLGVGTLAHIREALHEAGSRYIVLPARAFDPVDVFAEGYGVGHDGRKPIRFIEADTIVVDNADVLHTKMREYVEELVMHRTLRGAKLPELMNIVLVYSRAHDEEFTDFLPLPREGGEVAIERVDIAG